MASSRSPQAPDLIQRLRAQFGEDLLDSGDAFDQAVVRVSPGRYRELIQVLRDDSAFSCDFIDHVTAVDLGEEGFDVVTQLFSTTRHVQVRVKVRCEREDPQCPSIHDLYPGANWHERETWELFGIRFDGHPGLIKLLLPEEFEGFPGRKDFVLMSRVAKSWPGAVEGEEEEE